LNPNETLNLPGEGASSSTAKKAFQTAGKIADGVSIRLAPLVPRPNGAPAILPVRVSATNRPAEEIENAIQNVTIEDLAAVMESDDENQDNSHNELSCNSSLSSCSVDSTLAPQEAAKVITEHRTAHLKTKKLHRNRLRNRKSMKTKNQNRLRREVEEVKKALGERTI
jgi:hypothetical protein